MKVIKKLKEKKAEGYIDVAVLVLAAMLTIALFVKVFPVFIVKDQLNTLAKQTLREAEMEGRIEIDYSEISKAVGIEPDYVEWDGDTLSSRKVQFGDDMLVTFSKSVDIGFFEFGSFRLKLEGKAKGKSEVYWK